MLRKVTHFKTEAKAVKKCWLSTNPYEVDKTLSLLRFSMS